ncbi:2-nitropropane dioxygenase [[Bacillus] enclensis]|uniref:Probable nitronate monooxygenase n=1 Tax=[Bacillus] enclensis TaxID=1402860 RepID=A0A0V8HG68_9BACI|nr:nitronate monooxygenase [[Bacillus] enclensis]KSU61564.1 2-nitropropane dioxygenase [[Bacillus] enclensis]SCC19027.1 enoyl-[acyl-carrier protein] reductase II [[Bacillus] enclensis]
MNNLTGILNIDVPILQGGMGNISNAPLTAAVSEAGALGTIGVGTMDVDEVESIIIETKNLTTKPFALNIPIAITPHLQEMVRLVVKHGVPVVSLSAGNPTPLIPYFHEHGVKVICVVASKKQAVKAEQAGADIIVGEGYEAAGINSNLETTTLALIPQLVDAVSIPVAAAGGIGDGRGLASMLALGASGVQMGTRLIATKEAPFHENYKTALLNAKDDSTVIVGRSVGKVRRVMKAPYSAELLQKEKEGVPAEEFGKLTSEDFHRIGALEGKLDRGFINGGQISGLVSDIPTVKELIEKMMRDAEGIFTRLVNHKVK